MARCGRRYVFFIFFSHVKAVKILKLASSQAESEFQKEFLLMKNLRPHPNIIQVLGLCQKPFSIVTEFMPNGSLYHHIRAGNLKPQKIPEIIHGVVAGLFHLHTEGIVHRDLASRNVLLDVTEKPKISDFGMASAVHQQSSGAMYGPLRIMVRCKFYIMLGNRRQNVCWNRNLV